MRICTNGTKRNAHFVVAMIMTVATAAPALAETIEEVEKKATALSQEVKSLTADLRVTSELSKDARSIVNAKVEQLLEGGLYMTTMFGTLEKNVTNEGKSNRTREEFLEIVDGRFKWRQEQIRDKYVVFKYPANDPPAIGGRLFPELRKAHKVDLAADGAVDGERCWVVIVVPRTPPDQEDPVATGRVVFYIRKQDGVVAKTEMFRPGADKPFIVNHYSNIKINPKLDRARFQYKPPEGIQVVDETVEVPPGT